MANNNEENKEWIKNIQTATAGLTATAALLVAIVGLVKVFQSDISSKLQSKTDSVEEAHLDDTNLKIAQSRDNNNSKNPASSEKCSNNNTGDGVIQNCNSDGNNNSIYEMKIDKRRYDNPQWIELKCNGQFDRGSNCGNMGGKYEYYN